MFFIQLVHPQVLLYIFTCSIIYCITCCYFAPIKIIKTYWSKVAYLIQGSSTLFLLLRSSSSSLVLKTLVKNDDNVPQKKNKVAKVPI